MKNIDKLNQKIRKYIPRLMELEDGCMIKYSGEIFTIGKDCGTWNSETSLHLYELNIDIISEEYQIIGKEPMLNDVLEWLNLLLNKNKKYKDDKIHCNIQKGLLCIYLSYNDMWYSRLICKWDLSSHFLKDQSENTINELLNI